MNNKREKSFLPPNNLGDPVFTRCKTVFSRCIRKSGSLHGAVYIQIKGIFSEILFWICFLFFILKEFFIVWFKLVLFFFNSSINIYLKNTDFLKILYGISVNSFSLNPYIQSFMNKSVVEMAFFRSKCIETWIFKYDLAILRKQIWLMTIKNGHNHHISYNEMGNHTTDFLEPD